MKPLRVLVTGSAGFMGSHLCDYISLHTIPGEVEVYGVDDMSGGFNRNIKLQNFTKLDLRDREETEK